MTMPASAMIRRFAGLFMIAALTTSAALETPPEVAEAFSHASTGESGGLLTRTPEEREILIGYVKSHWKELLDDLDQVPNRNRSIPEVVSVVGVAAEQLPPSEYLDFLEHYLTVYGRGGIRDEDLRSQLGGDYWKNDFVTMNYSHPRIQKLLRRAKELVPKENAEFQRSLDDYISGKRAGLFYVDDGNFYVNVGDGVTPSPELLPEVLLDRWIKRLLPVAIVIVGLVLWKRSKKRRVERLI